MRVKQTRRACNHRFRSSADRRILELTREGKLTGNSLAPAYIQGIDLPIKGGRSLPALHEEMWAIIDLEERALVLYSNKVGVKCPTCRQLCASVKDGAWPGLVMAHSLVPPTHKRQQRLKPKRISKPASVIQLPALIEPQYEWPADWNKENAFKASEHA